MSRYKIEVQHQLNVLAERCRVLEEANNDLTLEIKTLRVFIKNADEVSTQKITALQNDVDALREATKPTISQRTTKEEPPQGWSSFVAEWVNGPEEADNG